MMLRFVPAAPLGAFVECLWASEREALPHACERNLPTGRVDLVIALRQAHITRLAGPGTAGERFNAALVQGPQERSVFRDTSQASSVVGVQFRAAGAAALLGLPMNELANRTVALADLWGSQATDLRDALQAQPDAPSRLRLLHHALLLRLHGTEPCAADAAIAWAARQFDAMGGADAGRVESVRAALGWSNQRFIAQFEQRVGLTPKRYARVRRFQSVIERVAPGRDAPWATLALDAGYADQPHLVREFRAFAGLTPGRYRAVAAEQPNHVAEYPTPR